MFAGFVLMQTGFGHSAGPGLDCRTCRTTQLELPSSQTSEFGGAGAQFPPPAPAAAGVMLRREELDSLLEPNCRSRLFRCVGRKGKEGGV